MNDKRFTEYVGVIERVSQQYGSDSEIYLPYNTLITVQTDDLDLWFDIKKLIKEYYVNVMGGEVE